MQYFDIYDKVYYNAENFSLETFPMIVSQAYDALVLGGLFIIDVNGKILDTDYVNTVLEMFFVLISDKDGIITYRKMTEGIESEIVQ